MLPSLFSQIVTSVFASSSVVLGLYALWWYYIRDIL